MAKKAHSVNFVFAGSVYLKTGNRKGVQDGRRIQQRRRGTGTN
jgi:hypothetical protein